ncbi:unnamed protein product [Camellia sinensis]
MEIDASSVSECGGNFGYIENCLSEADSGLDSMPKTKLKCVTSSRRLGNSDFTTEIELTAIRTTKDMTWKCRHMSE